MGTIAQDVPRELKQFARLFDELAYRHSSHGEVMSDWLDYAVACFLDTGDPDTAAHLEKRYGKEYPLLNQIFHEWLLVQQMMIVGDNDWYDALGTFYEVIASRYKSSWLGQFFTPKPIVDVMCSINGAGPEKAGKGETICDPCSGSGRMLIAWHATAPGNFQFGADVDPMCCKMTALNMLIHGCVGEAVCMNTLSLEWKFGFAVNPYLSRMKVPCLVRIEASESRQMPSKEAPSEAPKALKPAEPPKPPVILLPEPQANKKGQFSLF